MSMDRIVREQARLIILRELAAQPDGRLNSDLLGAVLQTFGITKSRDWVHDECNWLAEMGAITVAPAGSLKIAALTPKGLNHVERRIVIEGVKRPSLEG